MKASWGGRRRVANEAGQANRHRGQRQTERGREGGREGERERGRERQRERDRERDRDRQRDTERQGESEKVREKERESEGESEGEREEPATMNHSTARIASDGSAAQSERKKRRCHPTRQQNPPPARAALARKSARGITAATSGDPSNTPAFTDSLTRCLLYLSLSPTHSLKTSHSSSSPTSSTPPHPTPPHPTRPGPDPTSPSVCLSVCLSVRPPAVDYLTTDTTRTFRRSSGTRSSATRGNPVTRRHR
jgi:hypothetical protein